MGWAGRLALAYRSEPWHEGALRTVLHSRHEGPLRVLASLYPEAPAVCHNVLVHPPGGIVGGDTLHVVAELADGAHALVTTPGATRFYRSAGEPAQQSIDARVAPGARLEWLPLETIVHTGALAENRMRFELAPGAEMIGWDVLALGLPAAGERFDRGCYTQRIELPGVWLERARLAATDRRLFDSPLGWNGSTVLAAPSNATLTARAVPASRARPSASTATSRTPRAAAAPSRSAGYSFSPRSTLPGTMRVVAAQTRTPPG